MAKTFVYAIHNPNKAEVKIGYSSDPLKRLSQLQIGTTDRLDLLFTFAGGLEQERKLHCTLKAHRLSGEWFRYCNTVLQTFAEFSIASRPKAFDFVQDSSESMGVSILDVAYKFDKLFTVADLKKLLPSLALPTKEITGMLLDNGYVLKTYPSSRVKYFHKPKSLT